MTDNSLRDRIQGNWKQLSGGVHHEWGKLTHNDVEQIKGDVVMLAGKIEERYGVTKAEARRHCRCRSFWLLFLLAEDTSTFCVSVYLQGGTI